MRETAREGGVGKRERGGGDREREILRVLTENSVDF